MIEQTEKKEILLYLLLMIICSMNSKLNYIFLIVIIAQIRNGYVGFLKACLWLTVKQGLYIPPLVAQFSSIQMNIKLLFLVASALGIIVAYLAKESWIPKSCTAVLFFGGSALVSAVGFGSYPIAGAIKVLSFTVVLIATILAALECQSYFDLETYVYYVLSIVIGISFCILPYGGAYLAGSDGLLFRGIWNHPNDFGVICAIYLAIILVRCARIRYIQILQMFMIFIMIYFSHSRGAMISAVAILILYFGLCEEKNDRILIGTFFAIIIVGAVYTNLGNIIEQFLSKGTGTLSANLFSSRDEIKEVAMTRFNSNRLFGRGLLISYDSSVRSYIFSEEGTEPGNIFYELLGGAGIIGVVLFIKMISFFFFNAVGKYRMYILAAIVTSISEVSFFSVNNYASLYYILLALCVVSSYRYD